MQRFSGGAFDATAEPLDIGLPRYEWLQSASDYRDFCVANHFLKIYGDFWLDPYHPRVVAA